MEADNQHEIKDQTPFIKKFTQQGTFYIFDVNTNQIVEVEQDVYDFIDHYRTDGKHTHPGTGNTVREIEKGREEFGLFSNYRPQRILMGLDNAGHIKEFHGQGFKQLLLELTTHCNLNCAYCQTSGENAPESSVKNHMSREIRSKAVELFIENSGNSENPFISCYGGETLLCFDAIKETVSDVRQREGGDKYSFNLTTNGTLLTKEMVDFFIEHDFSLNISLDGPQHVHDRYRLTSDGQGTFQTIKKNLQFLKEQNPDYFARRVSISCVLAPPYDRIDDTLDFFSKEEIFKDIRKKKRIKPGLVNTWNSSFMEDYGLEECLKKELPLVGEKFRKRLKTAILSQDLSTLTIERRQIDAVLNNLAFRPIRRLYDHMMPLGACHIGLNRLFVRTNGDFYVCERSGSDYKIGHINTGLDYEQISYYYRKMEEVLEACTNCWAISHCERCWVQMGNLEEFKGQKKEAFCTSKKNTIELAFGVYVDILREDPDCLKILAES